LDARPFEVFSTVVRAPEARLQLALTGSDILLLCRPRLDRRQPDASAPSSSN